MSHNSPWDQPWGGPRRGHRSGSWSGGPPPWVEGLINLARSGGPGEFGPRGPMGHRGPKVRRGDVRAAILDVLAVEPMNGYQIIQQIAERSGGAWKPSPGSVYPTVQQLEDEGLVEGVEGEGRRLLQLTADGRTYVDEHPDELARTWQAFDAAPETGQDRPGDLKPVIGQVMGAVWQVVVSGTKQQLEDEGLVEGVEGEGRRLLQLTADGRTYVEEHPDELARTWQAFDAAPETGQDRPGDLKPVIGQVMGAVWQVVVSGTKQQQAEAAEILADTRRKLYGLLAEGDDAGDAADDDSESSAS